MPIGRAFVVQPVKLFFQGVFGAPQISKLSKKGSRNYSVIFTSGTLCFLIASVTAGKTGKTICGPLKVAGFSGDAPGSPGKTGKTKGSGVFG